MPQEDNKKVRKTATSYRTTKKSSKGEFSCSWGTFWLAISVILAALYGGYNHFKGLIQEQIRPIQHEMEIIRNEIKINEENRDKSVNLQIQIIEQKIEVLRLQKDAKTK